MRRSIAAAALLAALLTVPAAGTEDRTHVVTGLPGIGRVRLTSTFHGPKSAIDRPLTGGAPAYDYSVHLLYDRARKTYRLYSGGRWLRPGVPGADGDHVLQHVSKTGAPGTWKMPRDRPEFYIPAEEGRPEVWYGNNCLEPEVLKVGRTWYMYCQVQGNDGPPLPGELEPRGVDRIILFTSPDGSDWKRHSTTRGVVVNLEQPERTQLHHQEVIYVPWDRDGRPWWLYVYAGRPDQQLGYVRIRSGDPTTFDWRRHEPGAQLAQLGNQIGYARQAPGGPLFVRITFTAAPDGRQVPALQLSRDGMRWVSSGAAGPFLLEGSRDTGDNPNCYFLGLSTLDGTGEMQHLGGGRFRALYGATTSKTPVAPEIFQSEVGIGTVDIELLPQPAGRSPR